MEPSRGPPTFFVRIHRGLWRHAAGLRSGHLFLSREIQAAETKVASHSSTVRILAAQRPRHHVEGSRC
eukprot:COSAG03_NODE_22436_length_291_cov_0.796875_1_plen_67_part_01